MTQPETFWSLTGNSGTTPGTNFLGTTDDQAVEVKVNNARALRLESNATSPNLIGGHGVNSVAPTVIGATIGGGGTQTFFGDPLPKPNQVLANWGTVGGGVDNQAGNPFLTPAQSMFATVSGGINNHALGESSTVGGGVFNRALGPQSTIAGGARNSAVGAFATVPGGRDNTAGNDFSFAAGRRAQANHRGAFVWGDSTDADFASTTSNQFTVRATGGTRIVKGAASPDFSQAALESQNHLTSGESLLLRSYSTTNPHAVIKLLKHPRGRNDFLQCRDSDGSGTEIQRCHITSGGSFVAGSDFAEALPAVDGGEAYEPGDVLVLSTAVPGAVEPTARPYDTRVAGVYSTRPAVLGADKDGETRVDPEDLPVAILGIVPTKVSAENGPIAAGDLLTTASTPCHAMRAEPLMVQGVPLYPTGAILGKALEPLQEGVGLIRVLMTLR
jgi:hypothetical protein